MLDALPDLLTSIEAGILALASSAWIYPALAALAIIDGLFPPVPSETVVITLAVTASTSGEPQLFLVAVVAALGAWCGDQLAYAVGRRIGPDRLRLLRSTRARRTVARVEHVLERRGASLILAARYIPGGRVMVNVSAGAAGFRRRRFVALSAVAAVLWASTTVGLGLAAGQVFGHRPLLAMAVGISVGATLGFAFDRLLAARERRATPDQRLPTMTT